VGVGVGVGVGVAEGVAAGVAAGDSVGPTTTSLAVTGEAVALGESEVARKPMSRPAIREMPRTGMTIERRMNRAHVGSGTGELCH
jgi:hypothetical protein